MKPLLCKRAWLDREAENGNQRALVVSAACDRVQTLSIEEMKTDPEIRRLLDIADKLQAERTMLVEWHNEFYR